MVSHKGLILDYVFGTASPHDSQYEQDLLFQQHDIDIPGDMGFPSEKIEEELFRTRQVRLATPIKSNLKEKNSEELVDYAFLFWTNVGKEWKRDIR